MKESLISVVVPAYNAGEWIGACIDSVLRQTYGAWELIIIDDGSTDDTLSIARERAQGNSDIKVIHIANGGVCRARNTGMDNASGECITFLDADDELLPDALTALYKNLSENSCDIAICQKCVIKPDGTLKRYHYPEPLGKWSGIEGLLKSLEDHPATYSVWGKLYRKELINDLRFVEGRKVNEDSYFLFECLLKKPDVIVSDECIYLYNVSECGASRAQFSDKFMDILYFAEQKRKLVADRYPEYSELSNNVSVKASMNLLLNLCKTTDKKYREVEKQCIKTVRKYRKYFIPAIPFDSRWFKIITLRLYCVYKLCYLIKNR